MNTPNNKALVAKYLQSMKFLERVKAQELAGMTDEEAWRQIQLLNAAEEPWRDRPDWSGLIEQQAIFHRRKKA
jgi:hypothetical protein